uniref:Small ribosomal subunit protein mS29,mS29(DAP3) n=1 Tax=Toxoplasma gondii TaxID=5811 RepID=UPI00389B3B29
VGVEDVGRFRLFDRHRLVELLPEGLAGELSRDVEMIPSATSPIGVMLRKATLELQMQLELFARVHAKSSADTRGETPLPRKRKETRKDGERDAREKKKDEGKDKDGGVGGRGLEEIGSRRSEDEWRERLSELRPFDARLAAVQRGFLLDGHRGVGKSCVLNYLIPWARENNWLVVYEPLPSRYAREIGDIKRSSAGVYIQSSFSQEFLERLGRFNRRLLEELPVARRCYGQAALDGVHRLYAERSYHSLLEKALEKDLDEIREQRDEELKRGSPHSGKDADLLDSQLREEILLARERLALWHTYRREVSIPSMKSRLPNPASVWEIAEFGLQNEAFATQALYEVWEQLKKQTQLNVLIAVDEWNECFPVSEYVSMRYEGTRFNGHIPAFHLSTPRLLSRFDDAQQFQRGLKICATSWRRSNRRDYRPDLLGVRQEEIRTVRNFSPLEFANFVAYYHKKKILHEFPREKLDYFYMLSGGNGFQARRLLASLYGG